jgi:CRP-like cAMP-binding protein
MPVPTRPYNNQLLAALSCDDLETLKHGFEAVDLPRRTWLEHPNKKIDHIYFMESGIASVVATSSPKREVEIGIIGHEGMTGLAILHLNDRHPYSVYIQVEGSAQRVEADAVRQLMERSVACRRIFLGFAQSFMIQVAETAVTNARATVEERLARWLLMAQDRVGDPEIPLTHEFLSLMMASRRPGVTEASHELARKGLISGKRGRIAVIDREGLEERAGSFYGAPELELKRILRNL